MIYTVGYQMLDLDGLHDIVEARGIDRIIDVRSVPYSRKPAFNRNRLSVSFGDRYVWKGDVLGGRGEIEDLALDWLAGLKGSVLLMCMEHHPCDCHRYLEIGLRLLGRGVQVIHLFDGEAITTLELKEVCDGKRNKAAQYKLDLS